MNIAKAGEFSSDLLPEAVKRLAEMQNHSGDDFLFRKQVQKKIIGRKSPPFFLYNYTLESCLLAIPFHI
jgi:hypothetical protein